MNAVRKSCKCAVLAVLIVLFDLLLTLHVLLRRRGWPVNLKRVRRLYRLEALQLCHRQEPPSACPVSRAQNHTGSWLGADHSPQSTSASVSCVMHYLLLARASHNRTRSSKYDSAPSGLPAASHNASVLRP